LREIMGTGGKTFIDQIDAFTGGDITHLGSDGLQLFFGFGKLDCALLFALLFVSYSISYIRARAEGVGIDCSVGVFDRATRVFIIGVALIAIPVHMNWVIRGLLLGTLLTAIRRFVYVLTRKAKA